MPNTKSAKKALRSAEKKRTHNLFWKKRIKVILRTIQKQLKDKSVSADIIKKQEALLYKIVDKAAKNKVIHKNNASRIKSKASKKIAAHASSKSTKQKKKTSTKSSAKSGTKAKSAAK